MSVCVICNKEKEKTVDCKLIVNKACLSCCFIISAGRPEILKKMKNNYGFNKEIVMKVCADCQSQMLK